MKSLLGRCFGANRGALTATDASCRLFYQLLNQCFCILFRHKCNLSADCGVRTRTVVRGAAERIPRTAPGVLVGGRHHLEAPGIIIYTGIVLVESLGRV